MRSAIYCAVVHRVDLDRAGQRGRGSLRGYGIEPDGDGVRPLLFGFMSHVRGGGVEVSGMWQVFAELLLPFALGVRGSARGRRETSLYWQSPTVVDPDRGLHRVQCGSGARNSGIRSRR